MSRMEMREKWWASIYEALTESAMLKSNRQVLTVKPPAHWNDVTKTDFANLARDLEDASNAMREFGAPHVALELTKEQYDVLKDGMGKIKYGPWEHYEKPEEPIHRACMYCDGPVSFEHWLQHYRRERGITKQDAIRIWNNEFVVITCCHCTELDKEILLRKLEEVARRLMENEDSHYR